MLDYKEILNVPNAEGNNPDIDIKEHKTFSYPQNGPGGADQAVAKDGGIFLRVKKVYMFLTDESTGIEKKVLIYGEEEKSKVPAVL